MEKIPLQSNFKDIEPDLPSHRLGDLVTQNIGMGYDAHNAIADVSALQALFVKLWGRTDWAGEETWDQTTEPMDWNSCT